MARLRDAIYKWNHRLVDIERGDYGRAIGLRRKVAGETQWLIPKNTLIKELGLRSRYTREIEPLIQKDFMETNEQSRGTMKIKLRDRSERFFALWPDRIKAYDKTFSPPSEEMRTRLLARSGQCERLVRESDRRAITGVSRTQWWTLERKRVAPARLRLGCNSVAWRLSDLLAWIEQQGA